MARTYTLNPAPTPEVKIDYERELNPHQLAAVTAPPGPALVIAGAGSGKTRTLTYRVAYLLENGIPPENILLLTFTNKAAREMLERVAGLVPFDLSGLWGGTFHSVGNRILRAHADRIGFDRRFTIMDREDQSDLMEQVLTAAGVDTKQKGFPKPGLIGDIFGLAVNSERDLEELISERHAYFEEHTETLREIWKLYEKRKLAANAMDFDDLLEKALRLLRQEKELATRYQDRFQFILVDEYQDTSRIQADFIDLLAQRHRNLTVVGDDAQAIYSWRGADYRNILEFQERYPEAAVHKVEINYRSVPPILEVANAAIAANRSPFKKHLEPDRGAGSFKPVLAPCPDSGKQAQFVAQRILELHDEGRDLKDIAVLYRAHFHSMELQMELSRRGIPYQISSGLRFFEQAHIKDVAAFMKLAVNPADEVSFRRLARFLPGIGAKTAEQLWREVDGKRREHGEGFRFAEHLMDLKVPARGRDGWKQTVYTLEELAPGGEPVAPWEMIESVLEGVYDDYLKSKYANYESRREDLNQLVMFSRSYEDAGAFLAELSLLGNTDLPGTEAAPSVDEGDKISLSSVHQAKGLEWPVVFVMWLSDGMFPGYRSLENPEALEEERRLFYVAITRAMDQLYLSYPQLRLNASYQDSWQRPSRFLEDIPEELLDVWEVEAPIL